MIDHHVRPSVAEPVRSVRHRIDDDGWTGLVLGAALVAMALVTGLIYTFSVAVMPNLADADDQTFVATMQRFNRNPVFQLTFAAALVLIVIAVVLQRRHGSGVAVRWAFAALVFYGVVVAVTAGLHIPLNNQLDRADPDRIADLAHVRSQTEGPWVGWNVVRALFSIAAVAALARALLLNGGSQTPGTARACAGGPASPPPATNVRAAPDPPNHPSRR